MRVHPHVARRVEMASVHGAVALSARRRHQEDQNGQQDNFHHGTGIKKNIYIREQHGFLKKSALPLSHISSETRGRRPEGSLDM